MPQMEMLRLWLKDKIAVIVCNINFHMNSLSLAWQAAPEAWRHPRNPLSWIRQAGWRDNARSSAQSDALCLAVGLYKMMIWYADCLVVFYPFKARKVIGNLATHWWIWWLLRSTAYEIYEIYESLIRESFTFFDITVSVKRLTPLCSFGCSTWSCIQRPPCWPTYHRCPSSILRRQVSSQMLKQFGYGNTNAVMVRGPCLSKTHRAVEICQIWIIWQWFGVRHGPCDVFFFKENAVLSSIVLLSPAVRLCRSHWCCSCCSAGKYFHGCEWVWQYEVGMQQNSHGILLFGQVGESDRAAAEFADDNVTWSHLVTIENSGRNRMKQTDSLWMDYLRSATHLALKWADKRLTFFEVGCCMGWMVGLPPKMFCQGSVVGMNSRWLGSNFCKVATMVKCL